MLHSTDLFSLIRFDKIQAQSCGPDKMWLTFHGIVVTPRGYMMTGHGHITCVRLLASSYLLDCWPVSMSLHAVTYTHLIKIVHSLRGFTSGRTYTGYSKNCCVT
ncbi:hypothetical protein J6590_065013 [Homalodisca vitripennis]|nr:hypothetical protein J6590_065013 [Homalodisca vitripennis]